MFADDGRQRVRTVTRPDTDEVPGQRPRTTSGTPRAWMAPFTELRVEVRLRSTCVAGVL
jgi:hypothetical protein